VEGVLHIGVTRRTFIRAASTSVAAAGFTAQAQDVSGPAPGERLVQDDRVTVLNPRGRVPLSFIIDDSTCLVNMAHFGIPQFASVFPDRYTQPWRQLPREIPDDFVREFSDWCREHGVKGKYSVVPYPATVGWIDRELPGWSRAELQASLKLIRDELTPNWDIHPEMVSHTIAIDTRTGRPYEERTADVMENWGFSVGKSADELADYLAYALRILRNVDLPCEGITTPGGFGNKVLPELAQATLESCRDVFRAEIPHYFRHLFTDDRSVAPRVEYASGLTGDDPQCVVSIIGCTGDWFGGWDGLTPGDVDRLITEDLQLGRMVEVIERGEPAVMVCHWPGIYYNGDRTGFRILQEAVRRMHAQYDHLVWMKLSEIARYWAAKELTEIRMAGNTVRFHAPFACPEFTVAVAGMGSGLPVLKNNEQETNLRGVSSMNRIENDTWMSDGKGVTMCFDLPKGESVLQFG
jgi:hypothetical protein